jgi:hypothetical protein
MITYRPVCEPVKFHLSELQVNGPKPIIQSPPGQPLEAVAVFQAP